MNIKDSQKLKGLQVRLEKATAERIEAHERAAEFLSKESKLDRLRNSLRNEIVKLQGSNKEPVVSEHALLRYMERVMQVDLEKMKRNILCPSVLTAIESMGNGKFPSGNGYRVVVKDNTVITIEVNHE